MSIGHKTIGNWPYFPGSTFDGCPSKYEGK